MKVYVVRSGNAPYARYTVPFIEEYCRRHGYDLVFREHVSDPSRSPAWEKLLVHSHVDAEIALVLDLDAVPLPGAPPIAPELSSDRLSLARNQTSRGGVRFLRRKGYDPAWMRFNTGVVGVPRPLGSALARVHRTARPEDEIWMDQGDVNRAIVQGEIPVQELDQRWNTWIRRDEHPESMLDRAWIAHFAGNRARRVRNARRLWEHVYGTARVQAPSASRDAPTKSCGVPEFTTIVAVDETHLPELRLVWPTWRRHRPGLLERPLLIVCDQSRSRSWWRRELGFVDHPDRRIEVYRHDGVDPRTRMLTAFVDAPGRWVETAWHLKIDVDAVAEEPADWPLPEWFAPDREGREPVFVSQPWGFTKPPDAIARLDDWADGVPSLADSERLDLVPAPDADRLKHPRITSWLFFGRTDWVREMAALREGPLPVPSHDTYLWYCAARRGDPFRRVRMNRGWRHCGRRRRLERACRRALEPRVESGGDVRGGAADRDAPARTSRTAEPPPSRGVVYLLTGTPHAARLVVSLRSLRDHYAGPVTVVTSRPESHDVGERIAGESRLAAQHVRTDEVDVVKNSSFITKVAVMNDPPYDVTAYLDCDTFVVGPIWELFDEAERSQFCATRFARWHTGKRIMRKRIERWHSVDPVGDPDEFGRMVDDALKPREAVNCGVFASRSDAEILAPWLEMSLAGRDTFICDEVALQILLSRYPYGLLDCRWNCSPIHAAGTEDVRVWHMHGEKHVREPARTFWWPAYQACLAEELAGIEEWAPAGDRRLVRELRRRARERWREADRADEDEPVRQPSLSREFDSDAWQTTWELS